MWYLEQFFQVEHFLELLPISRLHDHDIESLVVGFAVPEHIGGAVHSLEPIQTQVHEQ